MRALLLLALATPLLLACSSERAAADAGAVGAGGGGSGGSPPAWLGDAGLVVRAPVTQPLRSLCGLAATPSDLPVGADPASVHLRSGYFDALNALGASLVRRELFWQDMEPQKGTFVFGPWDTLMAEAKQRHVRVLPLLAYGATWANPHAKDAFYPPVDPGDFATYAAAVARRWPGAFPGFEIWNEPNNGFRFWKPDLSGDPVAYGTLLANAAAALRAAAPGTPVALGGTVFTPQLIEGAIPWLGAAYAARPDLAKSFDIEGIHTYMAYPPATAPELGDGLEDAPLEAKIQMHAWLLAQHGAPAAPLWITEIGWPVTTDVDAAGQARYLVRATLLAAHAGAAAVYWYTLRDGQNHDPAAFPPEGSFGLVEYDPDPAAGNPPKPKPAFVALQAMLAIAGDLWPEAEAPVLDGAPADARAVALHGATGTGVLAAWTVTSPRGSFRAPRAGQVLEQSGAVRGSVKAGDAIELSGDVTYLR